MIRFAETVEDLAVKDRLWASTEREVLRFSEWEASEFISGEAYSDGQKDATAAAKAKGYPKGLIRAVGRCIRKGEDYADHLGTYRESIGLGSRRANTGGPAA